MSVCNTIAEGFFFYIIIFRFIYLAFRLIRLRNFCLVQELVSAWVS